jgi:hypothetical protein
MTRNNAATLLSKSCHSLVNDIWRACDILRSDNNCGGIMETGAAGASRPSPGFSGGVVNRETHKRARKTRKGLAHFASFMPFVFQVARDQQCYIAAYLGELQARITT